MAKTPAVTMASVWTNIDAWMKKHAKKSLASLQKGATKADLTKLEKKLGLPLPAELTELLSIHDGQLPKVGVVLVRNFALLSAQGIAAAHAQLRELEEEGVFAESTGANKDGFVKAVWWNEKWIPIGVGQGGDYLCIDTDPTPKGKSGQLVTWYHDAEFRDRTAESLTAYFVKYLADLEADYYSAQPNGSLQLN